MTTHSSTKRPSLAATMTASTEIQCGKKHPGVYREGVSFEALSPAGSVLTVAAPNLSKDEIKDYSNGQPRFRVVTADKAILTLWSFGQQPWVDAPFDAAVSWRAARLEWPATVSETGQLLVQLLLIDSATGIVCAIRAFTISPASTLEFLLAVQVQVDDPVGEFSDGFGILLNKPAEYWVKNISSD